MADYVLEIVEGPEAGRMIPLAGPTEIGRDPGAGVALQQDELLSRRHVLVTPEDGGARVEDLGSRNGTFVDGDEIQSPAHLAVGGQLLVGVTVLQLQTAATAASGATALRPIPADFTVMRPLPAAETGATTIRQVASPLSIPESEPDYVPPSALGQGPGASALFPLLDVHTKGKAKGAPVGIFVLVAFAVIIYFGRR
ncbi:MAG TPA: FHA domain-containing protein [Gaiellaceae bacterium]|nr:FHA domain-containing protein [Gaiellaceae bacterium]